MANNRMWLVQEKTGKKILLAKSMGTGWYTFHEQERIDEWFRDRRDDETRWGQDTGYVIRYEMVEAGDPGIEA